MVVKDAGFMKKMRISEIKKEIMKKISNGGVSQEKLLDFIEVEMGLSRRKAEEYTALIIKTSGWILEDGVIKSDL